MKRTIRLAQPIIEGYVVRELIKIIPEIEPCFTQRKEYDEYCFEEKEIDINFELLKKLNEKNFHIHLTLMTILLTW